MSEPKDLDDLVTVLHSISSSVAMISGVSSQLASLASYVMTDANNSGRIAEVLERLEKEHQMERFEEKRMNRDGEWGAEWFVEVPPRKPIRFDDEESAHDGARRAAATDGIDPETIVVFCTEVKRFKREDVPRAAWESA